MAKTRVARMKTPAAPARRRSRSPERKRSSGGNGTTGTVRSYEDALRFLFSVTDYERMSRIGYNRVNFNLSRMNRILAEMGNPHKQLRCIHVAGTKGKGSTAGMVAAMLRGAGHRVGLYTSPHLMDVRERVTINDHLIPKEAMARIVAELARIVKRLSKDSPTFFELMTAVAFKYFADSKVDYAVIEVGLGGRLDSTNVIKPEVCAITSIGYDHMALLGNTLASIAEEKAGIFKPGVLAIAAPQEQEALVVLRQAAQRVGCTLRIVGQDIDYNCRFESGPDGAPVNRICMNTPFSRFEHVNVPAPGEHQATNCAVALGVIDALRQAGHKIPEDQAVVGLGGLRLPGTMEMISRDPRILVDKAHNGLSIQALMKAIGQHVTYDSMVVIFGCCRDKDVARMLSALALGADKVIFTYNDSPRSADPYEMAEQYVEMTGKMAQVADDLLEAVRIATSAITRGDLICVTGSCYLVGRAKKVLSSGVTSRVRV